MATVINRATQARCSRANMASEQRGSVRLLRRTLDVGSWGSSSAVCHPVPGLINEDFDVATILPVGQS